MASETIPKFRISWHNRGSALVSTLLMIVVLTIIVTAFMQSMAVERRTATSYKNILQAELAAEAALNLAINKLRSAASENMIVHRTPGVSEEQSAIVVSKLDSSGVISASSTISVSAAEAAGDRTYTFRIAPDLIRTSRAYRIDDGSTPAVGAIESFGTFYLQDNASKQTLVRFPKPPTPRSYSTSIQEVPLILPSNNSLSSDGVGEANSHAVASGQLTGLQIWREKLLTVKTTNQLVPEINADVTWADTSHISPALSKLGTPKIDLRRLKYYVDSVSSSQAQGNPKSQVVEALLGLPSSVSPETSWGGGTLEYLISPLNPDRYSLDEARQIIASLIDYIDADLHPTTDNFEAPTYFGIEGRLEPDGTIVGHPYVVSIGGGLVFNLSSAGGAVGQLNSTRVLLCWTLANPWSARSHPFSGTYTPEFTVIVRGTAQGGNLGTDAAAYFGKDTQDRLNERLITIPSLVQGRLNPNAASSFPEAPDGLSFANVYSLFNAGKRQPAGMQFRDVELELKVARLKFTATDNTTSYVQVISTENNPLVLEMNPRNITLPVNSGSVVYNPRSVNRFAYATDPRLNFKPSSWRVGINDSTFPANPSSGHAVYPVTPSLNVTDAVDPDEWDLAQGMSTGNTWFANANTRKHFFARSPAQLPNNPRNEHYDPVGAPDAVAVNSIAEIGYLFTGRPWQTLRMTPSGVHRKDFQLLDFLESGTMETFETASLDRFSQGKININTASPRTLTGFLSDLPISDAEKNLVIQQIQDRQQLPTPLIGAVDYAELDSFRRGLSEKATQEELLRRVANLTSTRSNSFTVYAHGECVQNGQVVSQANLTATVELSVNAAGTVDISVTNKRREN